MINRRTLLPALSLSMILAITTVRGQDPPVEWGEIPAEDLRLSTFEADTNAAALILCDYGETKFDNDMNLQFTRQLRIKLFSQRGFGLATHSVLVNEKDNDEKFDDVEGVTYSLDAEGEIVETELDEDDIHAEELSDGLTKYSFTMPALTPGCIVEIQYEITSERWWWIRDWEFQYSEPVRWSEYRMTSPVNIVYTAVFQGYQPWEIQEDKRVNQFVSGLAQSMLRNTLAPCNFYRWAVKDAPAVRSEPFMTTSEDYINRLDLQLAKTAFPGDGIRSYLTDWQTFSKELLDDENFGGRLDADGDIDEKVKAITAGLTSQSKKGRAVYDWVAHNMTWDGGYGTSVNRDPAEVLEATSGSAAELSFLLVSMFRAAGLQADPVLISTRSNRKIQQLYPILHQFNHVIVRVNAGETYYVDGCDRSRPFHLYPNSVLNRTGFVVKTGAPEFPLLTSRFSFDSNAKAEITVSEEGAIAGSVRTLYADYSAVSARRTLREADKSPETLAKRVLDADARNLSVDTSLAQNVDSLHLPLTIQAEFSADSYASAAGPLIYVNPHIPLTISNPFSQTNRSFPVDFSSPLSSRAEVIVKIPPGFVAKELPRNREIRGAHGDVEFSRTCASTPDQVVVKYSLNVKRTEIPPQQYRSLREAYEQATQACGEQIVLERKQ